MDIDQLESGQLLTDEVFLVAESKLQVDRRGQNYYTLKLHAEGGRQVEAKVWSDNIADAITAGAGMEVLARVDEFRGKKQLNIQRYKLLTPSEFDLSPYVKTADIDVDAAFETLFNWTTDEYRNPWLKLLMAAIHENESFARQFKQSPAASYHHHNYQGGLAEHTLEVWDLAARVSQMYGERIDREILLAGAALHDAGKVKSYRLTAGISERTEAGELLDHLFISGSMVSNLWDTCVRPEVPDEKAEEAARCKALLLHVILAHHGKQEWGSPVVPRTPEALLLHHCDVISANMRSCFTAIEETPGGESWSDNVYIMDTRRRLYIPPAEGAESPETEE